MIPESLITPTISSTEAVKLYANLPEVVQAWLAGQGSRYGILPSELLMKVPENLLDNPVEIFKFIFRIYFFQIFDFIPILFIFIENIFTSRFYIVNL